MIIDHTSVAQFSGLTTANIQAAAAKKIMVRHASVGSNINDGLNALTIQNSAFNRTNFAFQARGNPGWQQKIDDLVAQTALQRGSFDVLTMKFCYRDNGVDPLTEWNYYRTKMEQLQTQYPTKKFVWWTMPLTTSGSANTDAFNNYVRTYANANNIVLFDVAAVQSHDTAGTAVRSGGYEALYSGYTYDGGHLNALGSERVAKAFWVMMARIAGTTAVVDSPPSVSITSPANNSTVSGSVTITANATDDKGVVSVQFSVDGTVISSNSSSGYSATLNTTGLTGTHTIIARATDTAGQTNTSSVSVTIATALPLGNVYISQNGTGNGSSCTSPLPVSWLNNYLNWGTGAGKIAPGTTVHLCGTITKAIQTAGSGTAGKPITIKFERDAKISAPYFDYDVWGTHRPAILVRQSSYIVIDGGENGVVESTSNGTGLSGQYNQEGVWLYGCDYCEVKNLTINGMYRMIDGIGDRNGSGSGIYAQGSHSRIHDNVIVDANTGVSYQYPGSSHTEDVEIYNNRISRVSNGITFGSGNTNATANRVRIYGNDISDAYIWDTDWPNCTGDCWFHSDGIQLWADHSGAGLTDLVIHDNYIHGDMGTHITGWIYYTDMQALVYNNILIAEGTSYPSNGLITIGGGKDYGGKFFNNILSTNHICMNIKSNSEVKNNIFLKCGMPVGVHSPYTNVSIDNNIYHEIVGTNNFALFDDAAGGAGRFFPSYSAWQAAGFDAHSRIINPLLVSPSTGNYRLQASSPAINTGVNMSSTCTQDPTACVDRDKVARPATGAWDIGPYEYTGTVVTDTPPTVSITSPTGGQRITGTVDLSATASDDKAVTRVDFLVDGNVEGSVISAPFIYSLDSTAFADGSHTVTARATDSIGQVTTSNAVSITTSNTTIITPGPDVTPPTVPVLSGRADSSSQITLSWTGSTDPIVANQVTSGLAGYRVYRNGVQHANVTDGTTYQNNSVTPNTTYTYQVSAYDYANPENESARSNQISVTTPAVTSTGIQIGDRVQTTARLKVRQTASSKGTVVGTARPGTQGTVEAGPAYANGYTWWNIQYDNGVKGWSASNWLVEVQ